MNLLPQRVWADYEPDQKSYIKKFKCIAANAFLCQSTDHMITATTENLPGYLISSHLGIVCGNTVRAKHVGRDLMAGLKTIVGGEISGYTEMLQESRNQAIDRMIAQAKAMGADAVVNVRFTTSQVAQGMSEMLAYGNAVKLGQSSTISPPPIS